MRVFLGMVAPALVLSLGGIGAGAAVEGAPPAAGQRTLFAACAACHGGNGEGTDQGPEIRGIIGRKAGAGADFAYSAALRRSGKTWTEAELAAFLQDPQAAVPGIRMAYPGASTPAEAADIAAYVAGLR